MYSKIVSILIFDIILIIFLFIFFIILMIWSITKIKNKLTIIRLIL